MTSNLDLSGLDDFGSFIDPENAPKSAASGKPLEIELDKIIEDVNQPRVTFEADKMAELTDSVKARGVKTPISVRVNPDKKEHYIINHGARRYRAAKAAGLKTVPAFVDSDYLFTDQLVENIQREALTLQETVQAIERLISDGMSQKEVAEKTGKSKSWVSQLVGITKLNDRIKSLIESGKCQDFTALNRLNDCYEDDPDTTINFIDARENITRGDVEKLRNQIDGVTDDEQIDIEDAIYDTEDETLGSDAGVNTLDSQDDRPDYLHGDEDETLGDDFEDEEPFDENVTNEFLAENESVEPKVKKPEIQISVDGREAIILLKKPSAYGTAWVEYEDGSQEVVNVNEIAIIAIVEAK